MQTEMDESKLSDTISLSGGVYIGRSECGEDHRLVMLDCCHVVDISTDDIVHGNLYCIECEKEEIEAVSNSCNVFCLDDYR